MYSKGLHELAEEEPPKLPKGLREKASISPIRSPVKSPPQHTKSRSPAISAPVKSRIAMWTEIEKEARKAQKSLLPHSSPRISPNSSPSVLRKQSPIDRPLFDDKKSSSGMKPGHTEPPILDGQPASDAKDTEYNRQQPAYVEIPILDGPPSSRLPANSGSPLQKSVSNVTPKTKRRWLRSQFGHRNGSEGDVDNPTKSSFLPNEVRGRGERGDEGSESSTASEVEEHGSSGAEEEEEEEDRLASIETSLDRGSMFRSVIMVHKNHIL